jgi:hypothetical protein
MSRIRSFLLAALVVGSVAVPAAHAGATARYVSGGVGIARAQGQTVADSGLVVCEPGDAAGLGGACLPFGGGDAVSVVDAVQGQDVAFQVCVDNNGDGLCRSDDPDPVCGDVIAFSHDDAGNFYNPVGPLPTGFKAGCPGGPFRGYIVYLCEGAHANLPGVLPHAHPATSGTASVVTGGEGLGSFCGFPVGKPYIVATGGNETCGLRAVSDDTVTQPDTYAGSLVGGPWHVAGATSLEVRCELVVNGLVTYVLSASGTESVVSSGQVSFTAVPSDVVGVCTTVTWTGGFGGGGSYGRCDAADFVQTATGSSYVVAQSTV